MSVNQSASDGLDYPLFWLLSFDPSIWVSLPGSSETSKLFHFDKYIRERHINFNNLKNLRISDRF